MDFYVIPKIVQQILKKAFEMMKIGKWNNIKFQTLENQNEN